MIKYEKAITEGLGFEIIDKLSRENHTYCVKTEGRLLVAKLSPFDRNVSYHQDLVAEERALESLHDPRLSPLGDTIPCVPRSYGLKYGLTELLILNPNQIRRKSQASFMVLLRQYIHGEVLGEEELLQPTQTTSLRNTVYAIQKAGFCRLDLSTRKLVVQEETKLPFLVDLSRAIPRSSLDGATFDELCAEDLEAIDGLGQG